MASTPTTSRGWLGTARIVAWWAVAIMVVLLFLFPDAVSRLRAMSAPYALMDESCSLADGPCVATFGDGTRVTLTLEPGVAVPTEPIAIRVAVQGDGVPTTVEIQGSEINMGLLRVPLKPSDEPGVWMAESHMPVCTVKRMEWKADVLMNGRAAGFLFWSERK